MNMIITMAGRSQRFKDKAIEIPKWQIQINDKVMLFWSMYPFRWIVKRVIFVTNRFDYPTQVINAVCNDLSISNYEIVELDETPNGQAYSASLGLELLPNSEPFAIWNIDTFINPKQNLTIPTEGCWLSLTNLPGTSWSFARFVESEIVEIAEKKRISEWASIGLYGFPSPSEFSNALFWFLNKHKFSSDEVFVAPLYEYWLSRGENVVPHFISSDEVIPLGTPQDMLRAHDTGGVTVQTSILKLLRK
jgi:dTDP-glucose pyrophosphorylase